MQFGLYHLRHYVGVWRIVSEVSIVKEVYSPTLLTHCIRDKPTLIALSTREIDEEQITMLPVTIKKGCPQFFYQHIFDRKII